jgi:hypothetical protein
MLKLNLKFENLEDILERFQSQIFNQASAISELQTNQVLKTGQRQLGAYLDRMSNGIHKEVGEKSHKFKLDEAAFLSEDTSCPDGIVLKHSVEQFIDKLDIVSQAILRNNKFKNSILPRVVKLEDTQKEFLSLFQFREEMTKMQTKL